jgi:Tfp pilus assembly protein PilN
VPALDPDNTPKYTGWIVSALSFLSAVLLFLKNHNSWSQRIEDLEEWKRETTTTLSHMDEQIREIPQVMQRIEARLKRIEEAQQQEQFTEAIVEVLLTKLAPFMKRGS